MHPLRGRTACRHGVYLFFLALLFPISTGVIESMSRNPRGCRCRAYLNCKMAEHGAKVEIMAAVFSDGEYK